MKIESLMYDFHGKIIMEKSSLKLKLSKYARISSFLKKKRSKFKTVIGGTFRVWLLSSKRILVYLK